MAGGRTLTVLLGAGASHDCADSNTSEVRVELRPPLVQQLFSNLPAFNEILAHYPKASALSQTIRDRVNSKESLEAILREKEETKSLPLKRQYWEVPLYLQELLGKVSEEYVKFKGGTRFNSLIGEIEEQNSQYEHVLYLTVNYDLFMEKALIKMYDVSFDSLDSYVPSNSKWSLIKLHGSVSWGRKVSNLPLIGQGPSLSRVLSDHVDNLDLDKEITILADHQERSRRRDDNFFYPALAVPLEGKNEFVCPDAQVQLARSFIHTCSDFLIIGFSGLDQHVVNLFKGARNLQNFRFVNGKEQAGKAASGKFYSTNNKFYSQSGVYQGGFGKFVASGDLRNFLRYG